ncbi:hypothetical protein RRG08_067149 [Elysia crispata]|uniref:Uncharacterized protein n=1 Tax=Elysia crispata TaxID=231223 RepID=A0AAE0XWU6_9GAST|nr:hypothetical protein RRG08_067149 [Elysia crispata]
MSSRPFDYTDMIAQAEALRAAWCGVTKLFLDCDRMTRQLLLMQQCRIIIGVITSCILMGSPMHTCNHSATADAGLVHALCVGRPEGKESKMSQSKFRITTSKRSHPSTFAPQFFFFRTKSHLFRYAIASLALTQFKPDPALA